MLRRHALAHWRCRLRRSARGRVRTGRACLERQRAARHRRPAEVHAGRRIPPVQSRRGDDAAARGEHRRVERLAALRDCGERTPHRRIARPARCRHIKRARHRAGRRGAGLRHREALRLGRDEPGRAVAGSARSARHRDEPPGRAQQFRRRRRRPRALWHRQGVEDQADRVGTLRRDAGIPGERRGAADQGRAGCQARRRRAAAGPQGQRADRAPALRDAGHRPDLAAAAPRHLFHRGPRAADLRPASRSIRRRWCR